MNTLGSVTKPAVFQNIESHKLMLAFTASTAIEKGQPVKLTTTGQVAPMGAADAAYLQIGVSSHKVASGARTTIIMKAFVNLKAIASGAVNAGPAKYASWNSTENRPVYVAAADADTTQAYILNPAAAAGDLIDVVII